MGLLKMDFLGLTTLTIIDDCIKLIEQAPRRKAGYETIPPSDEETFKKVFHSALTSGVFQFESSGMRDILRRYKPDNVEDLTALNALYRPGPMAMIDDFIERKWDAAKWSSCCRSLKDSEGFVRSHRLPGTGDAHRQTCWRAIRWAKRTCCGARWGRRMPMQWRSNATASSGAAALGHPKGAVSGDLRPMESSQGTDFNKSHSRRTRCWPTRRRI